MDAMSLSVFVEAVAAGSVAAAARRLKIDPLQASRRLMAIEKQLGVRLLQRTTRALSLTAEGEIFLPHAQALLEAESAALSSVSQRPGQAEGLLRVTTSAAFGRKILVPFAAHFMQRHPALRLDLMMTDRIVDLVHEGVDLAIRIAQLPDSNLIARHVADSPRMLVAAPSYLAERGTPQTLDDLDGHDCLCLTGQTHWTLRHQGAGVAKRVSGRFAANSIEGLHQACLNGMGIVLLSAWFVREELAAGTLQRVPLADAEVAPVAISALYPSRHLLPAKVRLFVQALGKDLAQGLHGFGDADPVAEATTG